LEATTETQVRGCSGTGQDQQGLYIPCQLQHHLVGKCARALPQAGACGGRSEVTVDLGARQALVEDEPREKVLDDVQFEDVLSYHGHRVSKYNLPSDQTKL
jgi:hypothetical protein